MSGNITKDMVYDVAKDILVSLGFKRKGKSCLWFSDEVFWSIIVEFQSRSWGGATIKTGVMWHWSARNYWSFDEFSNEVDPTITRHDGLAKFSNQTQFRLDLERLARNAIIDINVFRSSFMTLSSISRYLAEKACASKDMGWSKYHAGIAAGLGSDTETARCMLNFITCKETDPKWQRELKESATLLLGMLHDVNHFRQHIIDIIFDSRKLHGMKQVSIVFL